MDFIIIHVEQGVFLEPSENLHPSPISDFFSCPNYYYKLLTTAVWSLPLA